MNQPIKRTFPKVVSSRKIPDEIKATVGKLQRDPQGTARGSQNVRIPDQRVLGHVANKTIASINDARNMFQVLPDMDYARQIIVSATISPGDLTDTKVIYSVNNDELDTNLTGPMLREVQGFFDDTYRITKLLPKILNDVLFEKGSYPVLIMPESSIDQIINAEQYKSASLESAVIQLDNHLKEQVGMEGIYTPYGALGFPSGKKDGTSVSFESLDAGDYVSKSYVDFPTMESHSVGASNPDRKKACDALNLVSKQYDKNFVVTDNPNILKRPMVLETKRKLSIRRIYGGKLRGGLNRPVQRTQPRNNGTTVQYDGNNVSVSHEGIDAFKSNTTLNEVESAFYSQRRYQHIPVQPVLTKAQVGSDTYGHPVVMHLSPESVIPIHVPGNPAEHVAYFVLLDINGNPLNVTAHDNYYDDIRNQLNGNDQFSSQVLQTVRRGMEGQGTINNEIIEEMTRIHSETIESDLLARLRAGAMEGDYKISRTDHINQVMFSRHLKGQKTIMLYVPAEMMTYIAFDYNEFGVGKSLLEDAKILGSIRAALMLSNTLASINNAAGGKTITITLDPKDENPAETVEFLLSEHAKVNSEGFSRIIGQTHPLGLADQIQNHGVNVVVEGNTRYPETKFDVSSRDGTAKPIDSELEKTMRDRHFQVFGLSPEVAEGINQADFATTVVQNNLMLLKRVIQNQDKLEPFLCDIVRQYTLNSGILLDLLRGIVKENKKFLDKKDRDQEGIDDFIYEFIMSLEVSLPRPEVNDIAKQLEAYNAYTEGLEKIIDAYVSEEMFITDATMGIEEILPAVKKNIIAEFQRRWLRQRGVMPELDIFTTMDEEESPAFNFLEVNQSHMEGLITSLMKYMKKALKGAEKKGAQKQILDRLKEQVASLPSGTEGGDDDAMAGLDDGTGLPGDETGLDDGTGLPGDENGLPGEDGLDATGLPADDAAADALPGEGGVDALAEPAADADALAETGDADALNAEAPAADDANALADLGTDDTAAPAADDTGLPAAEEPASTEEPAVTEDEALPDAETPPAEEPAADDTGTGDQPTPATDTPPVEEEAPAIPDVEEPEPVEEAPPAEEEPPVEEAPPAEPAAPETEEEEEEPDEQLAVAEAAEKEAKAAEEQDGKDAGNVIDQMTEDDNLPPAEEDADNIPIPDAADADETPEEKKEREKKEKEDADKAKE